MYLINDQNEVLYRPVKVGRSYAGMRVIESGLAKSEKVIVKGLQRVQPGIKVEPKLAEMPNHLAAEKVSSAPVGKKPVAN